uniref:Uncharacterized protein n=1 Tax=Trypanosoma congolense (strain IL3000) TaxID=1068625 RepID=G0UZQ9_TRYCI|nr:conserved hypothetical protein [Trypanosoma congolense IL3000]
MSGGPQADNMALSPQFGWYQPRYLKNCGPPACGFPSLSKVVVSDGLNGDITDEEALKRRVASGFAWERVRPIEDIWNGPPMSDKVPPARDYERLMLDGVGGHPAGAHSAK